VKDISYVKPLQIYIKARLSYSLKMALWKSRNMSLLLFFNYINIIKVVQDYKIIYILLIIENITGMPQLEILTLLILFLITHIYC
jgi:hypothetical protein